MSKPRQFAITEGPTLNRVKVHRELIRQNMAEIARLQRQIGEGSMNLCLDLCLEHSVDPQLVSACIIDCDYLDNFGAAYFIAPPASQDSDSPTAPKGPVSKLN